MEVFCFRRVWELLTVEFFDAFTGVAFLVCVGAGGVPLDELAGVDEEAWRPRRTTADIALGSWTRHDLIIYK
jgi:hypothetical protein